MSANTRENNDEEDLRISLIDFSSRRHSLIRGVERIISDAIEHLKISLILPKMLENPETVIKVLTGTQFEPAIKLVSDFLRRREIILKEQRPPLLDHGMIHIIDYFQSNTEMYKLFPKYFQDMPSQDRKLMKAFDMLLNTAKRHLNRDANVQIKEERRIFKIYKEHKTLKKSIDKLKFKISSYQTTVRWKLAAKAAYLDKLQRDINEKQFQIDQRIAHEVDKTQRTTRSYKKTSMEKQIQLEQELERTRSAYTKQTKENKGFEKRNREEKNKLLLQLESAIKKYDSAMSEKIVENLELEDKLKEANKALAQFMTIYHKEERVYHEIVVKREEREEREKREKIMRYMMNRAARKIQKYWRNWRNEQKAKAKGKGGKKRK